MKLMAAAVLSIAAFLVFGSPAGATSIVYDNTTTDLRNSVTTTDLIGDEVTLAGTDRAITFLEIPLKFAGPESITITLGIYANDGSSGAPGTLLWSISGNVTIPSSGLQTVGANVPDVVVPDTFTWAVQAQGAALTPELFNPPTIGSSDDFVWVFDSGTWGAYYFGGTPVANFGALIEAEAVETAGAGSIPEPLTAMGLLIGLGGAARYVRRRK